MKKLLQNIIAFALIFLFLFVTESAAQKTELVIQTGHQEGIGKVVASPDGKYLLTSDNSFTTILWDAKKRTQLHTIAGTLAAIFLQDSKTILIITAEGYKVKMDISGKIIEKSHQKINLKDISYTAELYPENNILLQQKTVTNISTNSNKVYELSKSFERIRQSGYCAKANIIALASETNIEIFITLTARKLNTISLGKMYDGASHTLDFSADGKYLLCGNEKQLQVIEVATGQSNITIPVKDFDEYSRAKISPDQQFIVAITKKKIFRYNFSTGDVVWSSTLPYSFTNQSPLLYISADASKIIYFSERDHFFVDNNIGKISAGWGGRLAQYPTEALILNTASLETKALSPKKNAPITWNFSSGTMQMLPEYVEQYGRKTGIDTANKIAYYKKGDNFIGYDDKQSKVVQIPTASADYNGLQVSSNAKYMFLTDDKSDNNRVFNIFSWPQGTPVTTVKGGPVTAAFSKVNNWIALVIDGLQEKIVIYEIPSGKVVAQKKIISLEDGINSLQFSTNDNFIAYRIRTHNIIIQSVKGTYQAVILNAAIEPSSEFIFTRDEKYMVFIAPKNKGLLFFDIEKKSFAKEKAIECPIQNAFEMTLSANGRFLFVGTAQKNIRVFDLQKNKWVATLYTFADTGDWAVITEDGRFDATPGAEKQLYFVKGVVTYPLETLYENCYTPKLLSRILAGEDFPLVNINIDNLHPRPKLKIKYQQKTRNLEVGDDSFLYANTTDLAEITINATAPDDAVDEIRLFHNGKIVNLATRGLFVTDNDGSDSKKYTINLMHGKNSFRAIALNTQRTESEPDAIVVNYNVVADNSPVVIKSDNKNDAEVSLINKDATLHLIVVGINEYQNKTMSLNYAMADATSFKAELEKDASTILASVKTYFVTKSTADKIGITNAFKQVQQNAKPQDVFIFYYAGHGVIGNNKEFYLVPTDVSNLKNVQVELEQKGIASKLLQQYAIDIQAQKQLFILDACQSAGAFEKLLSNDGDQQKSLAVVARSTGTH